VGRALISYLGPQGSFTHAAALQWADEEHELVAATTVPDVFAAVSDGRAGLGVVAIENSVEGYVVPSLDAIVAAHDVVAVDQTALQISFDAFVRPGRTDAAGLTHVTAHPHGLAQAQRFVASTGLAPVPASSNAAACRDLAEDGMAIGPRICGELYGLQTWEQGVEDFPGARTRFLLLARRDAAVARLARHDGADVGWATMLAVTPRVTGPGVLARIATTFGERGVNMSSLITRPLKALAGRYVFVITCDGAPWDAEVRALFESLLEAGDAVKTLGVFRAPDDLDVAVDPRRIPTGSVAADSDDDAKREGLLWA